MPTPPFLSRPIIQPPHPTNIVPVILTVLVHLILVGVLYFGMAFQTPQPVEVELWDSASLEAASTVPTPTSANIPEITPTKIEQPSPIEVKPVSPPPSEPADIRTPEKPITKATPTTPVVPSEVKTPQKTDVKPKTKTETKPIAPKPAASVSDSAARTSALDRLKNQNSAGGTSGDSAGYAARVKRKVEGEAKIRITGQTLSASVSVRLAPNGVVISKKIIRSSGNTAWDTDLLAAIARSSPFPTPVPQAALNGVTLNFKH